MPPGLSYRFYSASSGNISGVLTHRNAQMRSSSSPQCGHDPSEIPKPDPGAFDLPDDPEVSREFLAIELRAKREAAARRVRFSMRTESPPPLGGASATCARIQMLPRPKSPFPGPPLAKPDSADRLLA